MQLLVDGLDVNGVRRSIPLTAMPKPQHFGVLVRDELSHSRARTGNHAPNLGSLSEIVRSTEVLVRVGTRS